MLLTVFEPAMKAPSAPTEGASSGYTLPTLSATQRAIAIGMLGRSAAFTPELIRMRTIGTVNSSTKPAPSSTREDSPTAFTSERACMPCRNTVISTTATRMPPGR